VGQLGWAGNRPAGTESEPISKYSKNRQQKNAKNIRNVNLHFI